VAAQLLERWGGGPWLLSGGHQEGLEELDDVTEEKIRWFLEEKVRTPDPLGSPSVGACLLSVSTPQSGDPSPSVGTAHI